MKYRVGDKVRVLHTNYTTVGIDVGTVHDVTYSGFNVVSLKGNDGCDWNFYHHEIEPYIPPRQIEVGGKYTSRNGDTWECILVRDGFAWLSHGNTTAYRWKLDGTPLCLGAGSEYIIDLGPKVETIRVKGSIDTSSSGGWITFHSDIGDHKFNMEVNTLDGVPDWSTAKISPA